jgi:hypothetical protein
VIYYYRVVTKSDTYCDLLTSITIRCLALSRFTRECVCLRKVNPFEKPLLLQSVYTYNVLWGGGPCAPYESVCPCVWWRALTWGSRVKLLFLLSFYSHSWSLGSHIAQITGRLCTCARNCSIHASITSWRIPTHRAPQTYTPLSCATQARPPVFLIRSAIQCPNVPDSFTLIWPSDGPSDSSPAFSCALCVGKDVDYLGGLCQFEVVPSDGTTI